MEPLIKRINNPQPKLDKSGGGPKMGRPIHSAKPIRSQPIRPVKAIHSQHVGRISQSGGMTPAKGLALFPKQPRVGKTPSLGAKPFVNKRNG